MGCQLKVEQHQGSFAPTSKEFGLLLVGWNYVPIFSRGGLSGLRLSVSLAFFYLAFCKTRVTESDPTRAGIRSSAPLQYLIP